MNGDSHYVRVQLLTNAGALDRDKQIALIETHPGDPDAEGRFGIYDCMGRIRWWRFEAVIGVGGISGEPARHRLAGKINWIGIGPHKREVGKRGPLVTFDRFMLFKSGGPRFDRLAPQLEENLENGSRRSHRSRRERASRIDLQQDGTSGESAALTVPRLLNMRQAAKYIGCSFWTVRDYVLQDLIPIMHLPPLRARAGARQREALRRVLIDRADLDKFVETYKGRAVP